MLSREDTTKFQEDVETFLLENGASLVSDKTFKEYEIESSVGTLKVMIRKNDLNMYSLFCRFEDPNRAIEKFDCNSFSGKYNFHVNSYVGRTVEEAIELGINHIKETL